MILFATLSHKINTPDLGVVVAIDAIEQEVTISFDGRDVTEVGDYYWLE